MNPCVVSAAFALVAMSAVNIAPAHAQSSLTVDIASTDPSKLLPRLRLGRQ